MGLHQQRHGTPGLEPWQQEERRSVFWSLYILDTTTSFTREKPKYLPLADCDVDPPLSSNPIDISGATFTAKVRLAEVQENIYQSLYSAEAARWSSSKRRKRFAKLSGDLERLEMTCLGESTSGPGPDGSTHFQKELEFAFCTSRILLYRSPRENLQSQHGLDEAARCLDIFLSLRDEKSSFGANSVLLRYVSFIIIPFLVNKAGKGLESRRCSITFQQYLLTVNKGFLRITPSSPSSSSFVTY